MENKWTHLSPNGMATNPDPEFGGIIDKTIIGEEWFVIFNNDAMRNADGFKSKDEAFAYYIDEKFRYMDAVYEKKTDSNRKNFWKNS